jgi:hypothetical protein
MSEHGLDPRIQKLMASLYGELSEEEEREFQALLAEDDALRAEWEELNDARVFLKAWDAAEPAQGFVFVEPQPRGPVRARRAPGGRFGWGRRLADLLPPPAWGFAGATAALVVLILAGFRVDRVDNGVAFRFGSPAQESRTADAGVPPQSLSPSGELPTYPRILSPSGTGTVPAGAQGAYVTQAQLDAYTSRMLSMMTTLLGDFEQKRNGQLAYVLQSFYQDLTNRQLQTYDELRGQIQGVGLGLMAEQDKANARLESLVNRNEAPRTVPVSQTPEDGKRGGNEDE